MPVGVRLSRLGDDAGELLAAAAVLGQELDPRALADAADMPPAAAEAALDELLRARLLRPAPDGGRLEFSHALVREAVLDELNPLRRARLHRRAAAALTRLGEDRHLEEIAAHLMQGASAADARRVSALLVRAGRRALGRLAYEDAAERFAGALEALDYADAADAAGPVLLARGDALLRAGEPQAAREAFSAAARLARSRGDAAMLAEAALGFAGLGIAIVDLDEAAIARLEEALDALEPGAVVLRSRLQARLAVELYYADDRGRSEALSAAAVTTARAAGDPRALAAALSARHVALWRPDRVEERLAAAAELVAAARAAGEPHQELQARNWRVMDLFELGDMDECRTEMARHARMAEQLRLPSFRWYAPLWAATGACWPAASRRRSGCSPRRGRRAHARGMATPSCSRPWSTSSGRSSGSSSTGATDAFLEEKIAGSPAGPAYEAYLIWVLAGLGRMDDARRRLGPWMRRGPAFDANWLSAQAEAAEAVALLGDRAHAAVPVRPARALCRPPGDVRPRGLELRLRRPAARRTRRRARPAGGRDPAPARRDRPRRRARLRGLAAARAARPARARAGRHRRDRGLSRGTGARPPAAGAGLTGRTTDLCAPPRAVRPGPVRGRPRFGRRRRS